MDTGPEHAAAISNQYFHVRVLLGMVVGLGLTHLIRHFARIIDRQTWQKTDWVHLLWAVSMFVYLLHFWWWEFHLSGVQAWTFPLYLFITLYALLLYLLCTVIFPETLEGYMDFGDYFLSRRKWFFGLLALAYAVDLGDTWVKGQAYFRGFGVEYPIRNLGYIALCLVAMATRRRWYHATFAIAGLLYQLSWIWRQFDTL